MQVMSVISAILLISTKQNKMDTNYQYWPEGECPNPTIYEPDEVQLCKLLGPDGKPYAIRRARQRIGFDLTKKESS